MNNQKNKDKISGQRVSSGVSLRQTLPFFIEFIKFSTGFVALIAVALLVLKFVNVTA